MAHFFSSYIVVNVPLQSLVIFPGVVGSGSISSLSGSHFDSTIIYLTGSNADFS